MASINDVPDHVLMEIFSFLPVKSLVELTKVSDRWCSLIKSSESTMKRFCVQINREIRPPVGGSWRKMVNKETQLRDGRHVNLCLLNFHGIAWELNDYIRKGWCCSKYIPKHPLTSIQSIHFMHFDYFTKYHWRKPTRLQPRLVWESLKSLKFESGTFGDLNNYLSAKISKLELIDAKFDAESVNALFSADQAVSYRELRIIRTDIDEDKLVDVIKLRNLKVAEFDLKYLAENVSVLLALSRAYKWKTLKFVGVGYLDIVRRIIESNSSVIKILFNCAAFEDKDEIIPKIFTCLPNIEHLLLPTIFNRFPKSPMHFAKLHTLEIEAVRYPARVIEFIRIACPNLKTLKIYHWIGGRAVLQKSVLENMLMSAEHLEELHLGSQSETDTFELRLEAVEVIKAKGKNLKRLTVFTSFPDTMKATLAGFHGTQIHAMAWNRNYQEPEEMDENYKHQMKSNERKRTLSTCEFRL